MSVLLLELHLGSVEEHDQGSFIGSLQPRTEKARFKFMTVFIIISHKEKSPL